MRTRSEVILDGLIWSWVRTFNPVPAIGAIRFPNINATPTGGPASQRLRQHVSRIQVSEAGNKETRGNPCRQLRALRAIDKSDCLFCQGGLFLTAFIDASNPSPLLTSPGRWSEPAAAFAHPLVVSALQDPSRAFVLASDALGWSTGQVRGVIVGPDRGIETLLSNGPRGELYAFSSEFGSAASRTLAAARAANASRQPFLAVLSGQRQDVAFIERDDTGAVVQQLRTLDFDLNSEVVKPFRGSLRLVDPVAATYRAEDDAYYILDRTAANQPSTTLYRLPRGNSLERVGAWRRPGNLGEAALTVGTDGTLVITTWNDVKHAIAVVDLDALGRGRAKHNDTQHPATSGKSDDKRAFDSRRIKVLTLRFGKGAVEIPAHRNLDSITLVLRAADGTLLPTRMSPDAPKSKDDGDDLEMDKLERAF